MAKSVESGTSQKVRDIDFLVGRVGIPAALCAALIAILWFVLFQFKKEVREQLADFRADMAWKFERSIRNERSVMQKLGIPVILDGDRKE